MNIMNWVKLFRLITRGAQSVMRFQLVVVIPPDRELLHQTRSSTQLFLPYANEKS